MKEGNIVNEIPPVKRRSKYGIDWDLYANLARQTGKPVLAGMHIRNSQVKSVRQYDRPPFLTSEGHIAVRLRNSYINHEDGLRYGDVYLEWIPTQEDDTQEN